MKMTMIECADKATFVEVVNDELRTLGNRLFSIKLQRNLYYSLSGSTRKPKERVRETASLREGYVAFIVYREAGRGRFFRACLRSITKGGRRKKNANHDA